MFKVYSRHNYARTQHSDNDTKTKDTAPVINHYIGCWKTNRPTRVIKVTNPMIYVCMYNMHDSLCQGLVLSMYLL